MPTDKMELMALAERVKASPEAMTANLLDAAWDALASFSAEFRTFACVPVSGFGTNGGRFGALLDARAYTDAALMLLPTDGSMSLLDIEMGFEPKDPAVWPAISMRWYPPYHTGPNWHALVSSAATLPLTIAAAALEARSRALAAQEKGEG